MFMAAEQMRAIVEWCTSGAGDGVCFALVALAIVMMIRNVQDEQDAREDEHDGG